MEAKEAIEAVKGSEEYAHWKEANTDGYLSGFFTLMEKDSEGDQLVLFYEPGKDRVISFNASNPSDVREDDVMKAGKTVLELSLDDVELTMETAMKSAEELYEAEYQQKVSVKTIIILQHLEEGVLWNITFVTPQFKTVNVRLDAKTGEIKKHEEVSLFEFS